MNKPLNVTEQVEEMRRERDEARQEADMWRTRARHAESKVEELRHQLATVVAELEQRRRAEQYGRQEP